MPKLSNVIPRYRKHKGSGQAVIRLSSRDIYLGKYGSAASREAYMRIKDGLPTNEVRMLKASLAIPVTTAVNTVGSWKSPLVNSP